MAIETVDKIEAKINNSENIDQTRKKELLVLLNDLKKEIDALEDDEQAKSIAGFAELSTNEAMRKQTNKKSLELSLEGLSSAVDELEAANPKLVGVINSISMMLSNLGI